ncbi:MAG: D-alanyl-D-alanine carboxypeptidase family protein, partial [Oscillospiraceae bacterium]
PPQSSTIATTTDEIFTNPTVPPQSSTVATTTDEIFTNPTVPPQSSTIATTTDEIFTNPTVPPQSSTIATTTDEIFTNPTVPPQSSTVATTTDEIFTNPTVPPQSSTEATTTTEATSTTQTISTDEISISNAFTIPSSLNSSQAVSVYGLLRSSAMMQSVTAGVFDSDDELITGKTVDVNSNSYDLKSLDNDILFDSLQPDNYHFQVIVTTINGTQVVMNQNFSVKAPEGVTYINGILIVNKTYSLPSTYNPNGLLPCVQTAFNQMVNAAKGDGLSLWVASGFRSYSYQQSLYNRYVQQYGQTKADTFSARAGHSEHQTGMAIDVNNASDSFAGTKEAKWLAENCWKYGFIIRYPQGKQNITGFQYEPWHVRWLGKKWASIIYHSGLTLEEYLNIDSVYR